MESNNKARDNEFMPGRVLIICDATKSRSLHEFKNIVTNMRGQVGIIQPGDTVTVLGVLHKVRHPMGYNMQITPGFFGTHVRAMHEEVSRKLDAYVGMLQNSAGECKDDEVDIQVKITAGSPMKTVVVQELANLDATWVIVDRYLRKELKFYLRSIPCKVALVLDNLSLEVLRPYHSNKDITITEKKLVYSLSKIVPLPSVEDHDDHSVVSLGISDIIKGSPRSPPDSSSVEYSSFLADEYSSTLGHVKAGEAKFGALSPVIEEQESPKISFDESFARNGFSVDKTQDEHGRQVVCTGQINDQRLISANLQKEENNKFQPASAFNSNCEQEKSGSCVDGEKENQNVVSPFVVQMEKCLHGSHELSLLCTVCGIQTGADLMRYSYSDIQIATNNFSPDHILGERGYGIAYRGKLKNGQLITAKLIKEANIQALKEFHSEIYALNFARHKNIMMLLGYCCEENLRILVYEYICYHSLEWHLFDNNDCVLEWTRRHAIAIGVAKGLRFLHEECQGSPIIHGDMGPSNILLTHDFVSKLGNWGLAKLKPSIYETNTQRGCLDNLGCLAPEYAESGTVSVQSDVYAFGVVLIQLISGRQVSDVTREKSLESLIQWACPLIETMELEGLVDPRLGDSYRMYELYCMSKTAYRCVHTDPDLRPSMSEVLYILEGDHYQLHHSTKKVAPHYSR